MHVAIVAPSLFKESCLNTNLFITDLITTLTKQYKEHSFLLITNEMPPAMPEPPANIYLLISGNNVTSNPILKTWMNLKTKRILKKSNIHVVISFQGAADHFGMIPHILFITNTNQIRPAQFKRASHILALTQSPVFELMQNKFPATQTNYISPFAASGFTAIDFVKKEEVKVKYSEGKEYFLYHGPIGSIEALVNLLKSFSHFKKRQQSSMHLIIISDPRPAIDTVLERYKYKDDVKLLFDLNQHEIASITASAYALILPFQNPDAAITVLNAMKCQVPVITVKNFPAAEIAGEAAIIAETDDTKELGDKMMLVYKDESLRSEMIMKGKMVANTFSINKSLDQLWTIILNTVS